MADSRSVRFDREGAGVSNEVFKSLDFGVDMCINVLY